MCCWYIFRLDFKVFCSSSTFPSLIYVTWCHYISGKMSLTKIWIFFLSLSNMFLEHLGCFSWENIFWDISNFWDQIFENKNHRFEALHLLYDSQVPDCKNILCCGCYWACCWVCFWLHKGSWFLMSPTLKDLMALLTVNELIRNGSRSEASHT